MVKTLSSDAGGASLIPGREAMVPHASWPNNQNIKQKQYCNKFSKALKIVHIKKRFLKNSLYTKINSHGFLILKLNMYHPKK